MFWGGGNFSCRHPKLWSYIKSNVKAFFITGAITFVVTASATTAKILHSRQVRYKNDKSVEQAINELYQKAIECHNYQVGDLITVSGEQYYVIVDSPKTQDYVIALKEKPLTVSEVNIYGSSIPVSATNQSGYGGMAFGTVQNYDSSNVKIVLDAWALDKFQNSELKTVDGYDARLITLSELNDLGFIKQNSPVDDGVPSWAYDYQYWTMTVCGNPQMCAVRYYNFWQISNVTISHIYPTVRPVINVYKSAITKVNNN